MTSKCGQMASSSFCLLVYLSLNSAAGPDPPLLQRWQEKSVIVCECVSPTGPCVSVTAHMYLKLKGRVARSWNRMWHPTREKDGGGEGACWEGFLWQADMLPYKEMGDKCGRRSLGAADLPLLRGKRPWLTRVGAGRMQRGPVWILWSVKKWSAQQRERGREREWEDRENSSKRSGEEEHERGRRRRRKSDGGGRGADAGME